MGNGAEQFDESFFRKYRELLDAEDTAFDELEHAYWADDLATWQAVVEKRQAFLDKLGLVPVKS